MRLKELYASDLVYVNAQELSYRVVALNSDRLVFRPSVF